MPAYGGGRPILLDLNGNGVQITDLSKSTQFIDAGNDGLKHRTAWAAAGDGVLFYDADNDNSISQTREYVFTAWDPTAKSDMQALRTRFDSNNDGKLTADDAAFAQFKVMVTQADGSQVAQSLTQLGITKIRLTEDATQISLADGSMIDGQSTFVMNGVTGAVASAVLMAEMQGYRVVEAVTLSGSDRVVVNTGYGTDGKVAFVIKSVSSANGLSVTNSFDLDGNGVVDRVQSAATVVNADGSRTETVVNKLGASLSTGVLLNRVVTTTSADGKSVVIDRDSTGGGWFDQHEERTTAADGSRTTVTQDLAQNGAVIRAVSETMTASGMARATGVDEDGNGAVEVTTSHEITQAVDNSRVEVVSEVNGTGTLRARSVETVSADGRVRSVARDLDGDGDTDLVVDTTIAMDATGATTSEMTQRNADNSLRGQVVQTQSADALLKTSVQDQDGDGDTDLTVVDATVVNADGSRVHVVTQTNTDGSVRGLQQETLAADKVSSETWVDHNQNGVFEATDLVASVAVTAGTLARTETVWSRNADGSIRAQQTAVTNAAGSTTTTTRDADGDGDADTVITDTHDFALGQRTIAVTNQDGTLRTQEYSQTWSDGLTTIRSSDIDGDGSYDHHSMDSKVVAGDGTVTRTVTDYAGNNATKLAREVTVQSADRLTTTVTRDSNGDGFTDSVTSSVKAADGSSGVTQTNYFADGSVASATVSTVSANGLVATTTTDLNGDAIADAVTVDTTTLNLDGSRVHSVRTINGDGSDRNLTVSTQSDDRLVTTTQSDSDGDGTFERVQTATTVLNANGSAATTTQTRAANAQLLSQERVEVSDDGLLASTSSDADGDGDFDLTSTRTTILLNNGSVTVTEALHDAANALRSQSSITTSDDGRSVIALLDLNGDGITDQTNIRVIADNGTTTATETSSAADGSLQARSLEVISDDGLMNSFSTDSDGDGIYERRSEGLTVLNANGSVTHSSIEKAANGAVISTSTTVISADGRSSTKIDDIDGNDQADRTSIHRVTLAADGVETNTVVTKSANGGTIASLTKVTSADGRAVTETFDADGNGFTDRASTATIASSGLHTTVTDFFSEGGTVESRLTTTISGDGLIKTRAVDRDAFGQAELISTEVTSLGADGSVSRAVEYTDGRSVVLATEQTYVSGDGLTRTARVDFDGDGVIDAATEDQTTFAADGTITRSQITSDATSDQTASIQTTTSGNGLITSVVSDFTGDGFADRTRLTTQLADGASSDLVRQFKGGYNLGNETLTTVSADGRSTSVVADRDGNGFADRRSTSQTDLSHNTDVTISDLAADGSATTIVHQFSSANGTTESTTVDMDGDGDIDVTRRTEVTFGADGSRITTLRESFGQGGKLSYQEVVTAAANGLSSTTTFDVDGDGIIDGTASSITTLKADGSRLIVSETHYADDSLRTKSVQSISADGGAIHQEIDYDGNGVADKILDIKVQADGSRIEIERSFGENGTAGAVFITETSGDQMHSSIQRGGAVQTIDRSALGNGSYVWSNGQEITLGSRKVSAAHEIDSLGVETWTYDAAWEYVSGQSSGGTDIISVASQHLVVQLDAAAKAQMFAEAARIYDAVLDRGIDQNEAEDLIRYIADGQLDKAALASGLVASGEFFTRYGEMNNAEFVTQIYLNTVGRGPGLAELDTTLRALASATITRAELALDLAEGAEHLAVGNAHMSTNNFDVIMNPAAYERSLDQAYVETLVKNLVDVVYDRDASAQELAALSERLLKGTDNLDDIATTLLADDAKFMNVSTASLFGLTGAALVEQAFTNALGRQPSALERAAWTDNLSSGRVTIAQFLASLSQSVEHLADGNTHIANALLPTTALAGTPANDSLTGTAGQESMTGGLGADSLYGGDGADWLEGGKGNDYLAGGAGSDIYVWSAGDGNDVIDDTASFSITSDSLVLKGVAASAVHLSQRANTDDLFITFDGSNEVITVRNQFNSPTRTYGVETIVFESGEVWNSKDILDKTRLDDSAANDTLAANTIEGSDLRDNISGFGGNDRLYGYDGDDTLTGGRGNDTLYGDSGKTGANGSDTYVWAKGDGADTILDNSSSLTEIDTLKLTDVVSSEVELRRLEGDFDLEVIIKGATPSQNVTLNVKNQYSGSTTRDGIERIEFSDGEVWSLQDIFDHTVRVMVGGNDTVTGTNYADYISGGYGNDNLASDNGDDTLSGDDGNDTLNGQDGADTYIWSRSLPSIGIGNDTLSDGSDTINDTGRSFAEVDVLQFSDVTSTQVELFRLSGSDDLKIRFKPGFGTDILTIANRYDSFGLYNYGIDVIQFSDGVRWDLTDILNHTRVDGSASAEVLTGTAALDNLYGGAGTDTINGNNGDDLLSGGAGADVLNGGNGNDRFEWQTGDGSDMLSDTGASLTDVDTLVLTAIGSGAATLSKSGSNLLVSVGTEVITVVNRFSSVNSGLGVEKIIFSDGVVTTVLDSPVAELATEGTSASNTITGWGYKDQIRGLGGADTLSGGAGDDTLIGGDNNDSLKGGDGEDLYEWASGDDSDTINDTGTSRFEIDTLQLTTVASVSAAGEDSIKLTRVQGGQNLLITIVATGEVFTVVNRFATATSGVGIEAIRFSDDVVWTLSDILAKTQLTGTSANDTLSGTDYDDQIQGGAGDDKISGGAGNDVLTGDAGNDLLYGGTTGSAQVSNGNDRFEWTAGNDTIIDNATSLAETDTLVLNGVSATDVALTRITGSDVLRVSIAGTTTVISVDNQFHGTDEGSGVEAIEFAGGVVWTLADILSHTEAQGSILADYLTGSNYVDNLLGLEGNDTIYGWQGDDVITGGTGNDSLTGGGTSDTAVNGSDTYVWSKGSGSDFINDRSGSVAEVDALELTDVAAGGVELTRLNGTDVLLVKVLATNETISVKGQFRGIAAGWGVEAINFAGDTTWALDDIREQTKVNGTDANDIIAGTTYRDNLYGGVGNDSLNGGDGNDWLYGGMGADRLDGGKGVNTVSYANADLGVSVDLNLATAQIGSSGSEAVGDILLNIHNIDGSKYSDQIWGDGLSNVLTGNDGNDSLYGLNGFDQISGGAGLDTIYGGDGADEIFGDADAGSLFGDTGDDSLFGGNQADTISGGVGDDVIDGGGQDDWLTGGAGADVFVFTAGFGSDIITDFDGGSGGDRIDLRGVTGITDYQDLITSHMSQSGANVLISNLAGETILIQNAVVDSMLADGFMFL